MCSCLSLLGACVLALGLMKAQNKLDDENGDTQRAKEITVKDEQIKSKMVLYAFGFVCRVHGESTGRVGCHHSPFAVNVMRIVCEKEDQPTQPLRVFFFFSPLRCLFVSFVFDGGKFNHRNRYVSRMLLHDKIMIIIAGMKIKNVSFHVWRTKKRRFFPGAEHDFV